jgi:transposase InsO family protein
LGRRRPDFQVSAETTFGFHGQRRTTRTSRSARITNVGREEKTQDRYASQHRCALRKPITAVLMAVRRRRPRCWDKAVAESFFSSLKKERIKKKIYRTRELAQAEISDYSDSFYIQRAAIVI